MNAKYKMIEKMAKIISNGLGCSYEELPKTGSNNVSKEKVFMISEEIFDYLDSIGYDACVTPTSYTPQVWSLTDDVYDD